MSEAKDTMKPSITTDTRGIAMRWLRRARRRKVQADNTGVEVGGPGPEVPSGLTLEDADEILQQETWRAWRRFGAAVVSTALLGTGLLGLSALRASYPRADAVQTLGQWWAALPDNAPAGDWRTICTAVVSVMVTLVLATVIQDLGSQTKERVRTVDTIVRGQSLSTLATAWAFLTGVLLVCVLGHLPRTWETGPLAVIVATGVLLSCALATISGPNELTRMRSQASLQRQQQRLKRWVGDLEAERSSLTKVGTGLRAYSAPVMASAICGALSLLPVFVPLVLRFGWTSEVVSVWAAASVLPGMPLLACIQMLATSSTHDVENPGRARPLAWYEWLLLLLVGAWIALLNIVLSSPVPAWHWALSLHTVGLPALLWWLGGWRGWWSRLGLHTGRSLARRISNLLTYNDRALQPVQPSAPATPL